MPQNNTQYSEEIQQLMGKMPNWIIRWGIAMIFIVLLIILGICYFIKYPQLVSAPVVLTTVNPPVDLLAKSSGRIEEMFISHNDQVSQGTPIAVLSNTADYRAVILLSEWLRKNGDNWDAYIRDSANYVRTLGELQSSYSQFYKQLKLYANYLDADRYTSQLSLLKRQLANQQKNLEYQKIQYDYSIRDLEYENRKLERDSIVHKKNSISLTEYEAAKQSYLYKESSLLGSKMSLNSSELAIYSLQDQIIELTMQYENQLTQYELQLSESRQQLQLQIVQWEKQYVLKSPIEGQANFAKYWSTNQNVIAGDRLATIIPMGTTAIIGKLSIPSSGYAKIKVGDAVNVKLAGYPYMEYGLLKGRISSLSAVPEIDKEPVYMAEVEFPDGLKSSYNIQLNFIQQMDGTAEVIIKDMRLLDKFLMPLKSILKNDLTH